MLSKQSAKPGKKSRSKSLGPGGLEALKEASGNSQKVMPVIRSILKPVIPLSPPKPIPPRTPKTSDSTWDTSASPARRTRLSVARESQSPSKQDIADTGAARQNESGAQIALRTEEEQQAAARTREREEAIRRRDERRKSLANRRVSFAPEATLHTWDIIETNEDATTSSEATNSTRRQSKGDTLASDFTHGTQHDPNSDNTIQASNTLLPELESGPLDDPSNLPQTRRRSIETAAADFDNRNELSSSPGSIMADDMTQSSFVTNPEEEADDISDTDTYRDDDSTAMDIDEDEATSNSVGSGQTDETSSSSSSALDARLRQAIQQAGTQRLQHFDEPTGNDEKDDIQRILKPSHDKARELQRVFDEVQKGCEIDKNAKDWARLRSVYRKALRGTKASKVEQLMADILDSMKRLALSQVFKLAQQDDLITLRTKVETAIQELSNVDPSLPDSEFGADGPLFASQDNASNSQQYNVTGGASTFYSGQNSGQNYTGDGYTFNYGKGP